MRLFVQALIYLFLVGTVCSNSLPVLKGNDVQQSRAVVNGGTLAAAGDFPYAVFLSLTNGMFVGGGTLIGSSHVLTSAQGLLTLSSSFMSMLRVTFNSSSTYGGVGAFLLPVSKVVIHELYNVTTSDNNLALVVLSSPVTNLTFASLPALPATVPPSTTKTFKTTKSPPPTTKTPETLTKTPPRTTKTPPPTTKTTTTQTKTPVPTTKTPLTTTKTTAKTTTKKPGPTTKTTAKATFKPIVSQKPLASVVSSFNRASSSYANMSAVIAGWGRSTLGVNSAPLLLRKVNATILDNQNCTSYYGNSTFFGADMLCSSAPVPCMDDTGSPILVDGVQVGITMWCASLTAGSYFGIYTRVTTYVDWIANAMANNPGPVIG